MSQTLLQTLGSLVNKTLKDTVVYKPSLTPVAGSVTASISLERVRDEFIFAKVQS